MKTWEEYWYSCVYGPNWKIEHPNMSVGWILLNVGTLCVISYIKVTLEIISDNFLNPLFWICHPNIMVNVGGAHRLSIFWVTFVVLKLVGSWNVIPMILFCQSDRFHVFAKTTNVYVIFIIANWLESERAIHLLSKKGIFSIVYF